jgi:hypothetical protein
MAYEAELDEKDIEKEIFEDEIDNALSLIENDEKQLVKKEEITPAVKQEEITINDITKIALDSYRDIQKHSDEIYDAFYGNVATRQDRSDVSKQMLTDSQRLKIESINALTNLANAKAKLIAAQAKATQGNVGIFIDTKKGEDLGINLANLKD